MSAFVLTVGTESSENSTVDSITGDPNFVIVLAAAPTRTIVVGDVLTDSASNEYVVTVVTSQTQFTVIDHKQLLTDPVTGAGSTGRAYANLTNAEPDIGNYAASGDTIEWRNYNDGTLDDKLSMNDTSLGTGGTLTVTSPVGERHTGSAGTGFTIDPSTDGTVVVLFGGAGFPNLVFEFLEFTGWDGADSRCFRERSSEIATSVTIRQCLIHDSGATGTQMGIEVDITGGAGRVVNVENCLIYDINGIAIGVESGRTGCRISNCVIRNNGTGIEESLAASDTLLVQNCAVFDNTTNFSGSDWHADSDYNASNTAASSMPNGDTGNNKGGLTSSNEFVNLTGGSEDFRLKAASVLVNAGTDLSSTFTKDVIGNFRALQSLWDIGAFDWDVVVSTIGNRTDTNVTISSVSGEAPEWEVTLSAAAPAAVVIGEIINDGTTDFLIRKIAGTVLTVRRVSFSSVVDPVTGASTIDRAYTKLADAETDMGNIAEAGNTWEVRFYDDGLISEAVVTINADVVGSGGKIVVTVAAGERHDGTVGTGVQWQVAGTGNGNWLLFSVATNTPAYLIEWLEIVGQKTATSFAILLRINKSKGGLGNCVLRNLIIHGLGTAPSSSDTLRGVFVSAADVRIQNCLIYDIDGTNTSSSTVDGIDTGSSGDNLEILNCTLDNISKTGINIVSGATGAVVRNVAAFNCNVAFANADGGGWGGTSGNNATDDATAPGNNNQVSKVAAAQFESLTLGEEDYHLKLTGTDCEINGADLSATFTDDLEGILRTIPWDISALVIPTLSAVLTDPTDNQIGRVDMDDILILERDTPFGTYEEIITPIQKWAVVEGTTDRKANRMFGQRVSLAASIGANTDVDVQGVERNIFDDLVTMDRVKLLLIINRSDELSPATAAVVKIGGNFITTHVGAGAEIPVSAGGRLVLVYPEAGLDSTSGKSVINVKNATAALARVDVIVLGHK